MTEQQSIAQWLDKVRFKRSLFGLDERDVWKKISQLDELYQQALRAERARYDALLDAMKAGEGRS